MAYYLPISSDYALLWTEKKVSKRANIIINNDSGILNGLIMKTKVFYFSVPIESTRFVIARDKKLLQDAKSMQM